MTTIDKKKLVGAIHDSCIGGCSYWGGQLDNDSLPLTILQSINSLSIPMTNQVSFFLHLGATFINNVNQYILFRMFNVLKELRA